MPLPRIQFTVRRMMIGVAIAAVALAANDLRRRRARYDSLRNTHEWQARASRSRAEKHASVAAANEREVKRLRTAVRTRHDAPRQEAELIAHRASSGATGERGLSVFLLRTDRYAVTATIQPDPDGKAIRGSIAAITL